MLIALHFKKAQSMRRYIAIETPIFIIESVLVVAGNGIEILMGSWGEIGVYEKAIGKLHRAINR